jgi:N-acetylneuraminic acid mutarotase
VAFVLNGKGYICTGYSNGEYSDDFYRYDPATNVWTAMRKISNVSSESYDDLYMIMRKRAVAFVMNGKAYVTSGENSSYKKDVWEYTPETDLWKSVSVLEGAARVDAIAFSILDDRGYIATGVASSTYLDDTWEFKPLEIYDPED